MWGSSLTNPSIPPKEELASGGELPYIVWKTLNRMRVEIPKCKTNLKRWSLLPADESILCKFGAVQDTGHLLVCPQLDQHFSMRDLLEANDKAVLVANFWKTEV
uniref:Uncharacterized protein n=1 Tax=Cuerna arida TaxID=1464854 RepID=A0A1B6G3W3_9HEMI